MTDKGKTFAKATIERAGFRKASKILAFYIAWGLTHQELGHQPSVEEYAAYWKVSFSTGYRELRLWREVWPELDTPSELAEVLGLQLDAGESLPNPTSFAVPAGGFA